MNLRRTLLAVLICVLACAWTEAQLQNAAASPPAAQRASAAQAPEDAFLSSTRYTNAYFGFEFDFPPEARLAPVSLPTTLDRRIQLLELIGPAPGHAAVSIFAYEYKGKNWTDAKGILRHELEQDLYTGVEELHGLSKTTIDGHQFYCFETRKGVAQHEELTTELNGYVLLVVLQANDPQMVKTLASAFSQLKFFPPQEAQQQAGSEAVAYEGPAISSQHLHDLKASPPAERMDPGRIDGNVYLNVQIGMQYEFPKGWSVQPQGAVEPAVLRYRERVSGEPIMGPREREVLKACRRTLFSAWKTKPDVDGDVPYDEFGEVTLSAMPLSCFPNIRFPDDPHDGDAVRRFLVGFSYSHPLQHDMSDARTFDAGGKTFVLTHGTIAYKEAGDALSRRISVALAMTQQRGYLLVWLYAAPHDAELRELLNARMGFDSDPAIKTATTIKAAGSAEPSENHQQPANPSATSGTAGNAAGAGTPSSASASGSGSTEPPASQPTPDPASGSQAYARPSLLRDGEHMQGTPVPNKKPD